MQRTSFIIYTSGKKGTNLLLPLTLPEEPAEKPTVRISIEQEERRRDKTLTD